MIIGKCKGCINISLDKKHNFPCWCCLRNIHQLWNELRGTQNESLISDYKNRKIKERDEIKKEGKSRIRTWKRKR